MRWESHLKKLLPPIFLFSISFYLFYQYQYAVKNIPGFDGYYHIKMAEVIRDGGVKKDFPWLTAMKWLDHQLLYHIFLIPFTYLGLYTGAKISTIFFFSLLTTSFYLLLRSRHVPFPFIWTLLLFVSSIPFLYRMATVTTPCVALIFLIIAIYLIFEERYILLAVLSSAFVWLYGGFSVIIILGIAVFLCHLLLSREFNLKPLLSIIAGVIVGLTTNPFFPDIANLVYVQTTKAGVGRIVQGGGLWQPYSLQVLFKTSILTFVLYFISLSLIIASKNKPDKDTVVIFLMSIVSFIMYIKARRFVEYWVPFSIMSSSFMFRDAVNGLAYSRLFKKRWLKNSILLFMVVLLSFLIPYKLQEAKGDLRDDLRIFERYKGCAEWLRDNTPGSAVYTTDWDDFPELFFYNSKNKYLVGLDPAFMYLYNKALYEKWKRINEGDISDNEELYKWLVYDFKTPYIFTDTGHGDFIRMVERNPYIKLEYSDLSCKVYSVKGRGEL